MPSLLRFALALTMIFLAPARTIRVATYNVSMSLNREGQLVELLEAGTYTRARRIAEVVQIIQPDVVVLNEFDYDAAGRGAELMNENFFKVSQSGRPAQDYPYRYVAISNTGIHSGFDLDNNGVVDRTPGDRTYGGDAFGFGEFPGKFAMAVFSKFPIKSEEVRTFEELLWKDMPDNLIPPGYYTEAELEVFRLSSKSHWDVPIELLGTKFHFLVSHPTPPVFDGAEDRNGRRNHDEIRLWADYLTPGAAGYLGGGLGANERFVIAGDQNADPVQGDSVNGAINQLLDHPRVAGDFIPERTGARTSANRYHTATFGLRVDYVLPSRRGFAIEDGAVFWPTSGQEGASLVTESDHRLVYLDLKLVPLIHEAVQDLRLARTAGELQLSWQVQEEISYRLETTTNLAAAAWESVPGVEVVLEDGLARAVLPPPSERRFYRVAAFYE